MRAASFAGALALLHLAACSRFVVLPAADGQKSYVHACASCHGMDARGGGPAAPALRVQPPDLTALSARNGGTFPRDLVIAVIAGEREVPAHGTREMPVWSQRFGPASGGAAVASIYTRRHLEMLTDYLESLQRPQ